MLAMHRLHEWRARVLDVAVDLLQLAVEVAKEVQALAKRLGCRAPLANDGFGVVTHAPALVALAQQSLYVVHRGHPSWETK